MTFKIKLISVLMFSICIGIGTLAAQKVVVKNGVEYIENEDAVEDLNSIKAPSNALATKVKKQKSKKVEKTAVISGIKKVNQKRRLLRFRKKRKNNPNKCYKDTKSLCQSIEKKRK